LRRLKRCPVPGKIVTMTASQGPSWTRLKLELRVFDREQFAPLLRRFETAGICWTTMAELGDTSASRRRLYELNKTCSADIPERGDFTASTSTSSSG
jgi:hypothetical protein